MSDQVRIVEVGPRDGLQNEKTPVSAETRIAFIENLIKAGLHTIEVGSFVSPRAIPQMVNSDQVLRAVDHHPGYEFHVLVPNEKGYDAAKAAALTVNMLGGRIDDDMRAELQRLLVKRGRKDIVHDQLRACFIGHFGHGGDIDDGQADT